MTIASSQPMHLFRLTGLISLLCWPTFAPAETASPTKRDANVSVQVFSDREAITPGEEFEVAVVLTPDKEWHVYWRSPGGMAGLPTEITWKVPTGFHVGRVQFPIPKIKYDKILKEDAYVLAGESIFPVTIRVPESVKPGEKVSLTVNVSYLACKQECIPGEVELSLTLPVAARGTAVKPANEALFKRARRAMPEPLSAAKHVRIDHRLDREQVRPGESFTAALVLDIAPRHHMQSRKPSQEEFIPTVLYLEPTTGLEFGELEYPKAHDRVDPVLGKLSEYGGKVEIRIPVTVAEDAGSAPRWIRGLLQYQVCNESGTCYPPQWIEVAIPIRMQGGPAPTAMDSSAATEQRADHAAADTVDPTVSTGQTAAAEPAPVQTDWFSVAPVPENTVTAEQAASVAVGEPASDTTAASSIDEGRLNRLQNWFIEKGYYGVIALALIGGFILNLMPCVLPVISLKVLSFVRQAQESRGRVFLLGLAYCAGVMSFFGLIAWLFAKHGSGWGEHFQRPLVVLILAGVVTAFALSLFGVFALFTPRIVNKLGEKAEAQEGFTSAYFTGVLATVLGTACTAPFLSAAVSAASRFSPQEGAGIFMAVGAGMAFPFLVLSAQPAWLKFVPRPGPWMGVFEAAMGFLLLGTVIWLLYPIRGQLGDWGLYLTLMYLLGVGIAAWIKGKVQFHHPPGRKLAINGLAVVALLFAWMIPFRWVDTLENLEAAQARHVRMLALAETIQLTRGADSESGAEAVSWNPAAWDEKGGSIPWVPYDPALVERFVRAGYTVFVDFTADWCVNCKANLKSSIDIAETRRVMRELNVVPFEADYTRRDPQIKEMLDHYGRAGVPLYLVFAPNQPDRPQILPELLTPGILIDALNRAGPSKSASTAYTALRGQTAP